MRPSGTKSAGGSVGELTAKVTAQLGEGRRQHDDNTSPTRPHPDPNEPVGWLAGRPTERSVIFVASFCCGLVGFDSARSVVVNGGANI